MTDIVRRLVNGIWTTEAADAGGGGSLPAGGTTGEVLTKVSDADGDADWEAGGGSLTYESAYLSGDPVEVADQGVADLLWNILDAGDEILDITDPELPVVLTAGLFIVSAEVRAFGMTPGGSAEGTLTLDFGGDNAEMNARSVVDATGRVRICISSSYPIPEGGGIRLVASNQDGVAARNFEIKNATVSRIGPAA